MATNNDSNWVTINGGKFPATIGEEFINTWGKWQTDGDGFKFNDYQATWQDSQYNGSFRDYVGINSDKNMLYWMKGNYGDKKKDFDFNAWADAHPDEYKDYRDENGTWYLTPEGKTDLEGRAYTQWLKEQKYDVNNTNPVVQIKTGKKEGTQVTYKWDESLNAYVPHEGKVVYWDTSSGLGHALKSFGSAIATGIASYFGGPWAGAAVGAASGLITSEGDNKLLDAGMGALGGYMGGANMAGNIGATIGGSAIKGITKNALPDLVLNMVQTESDPGNLAGIVNQWKVENGKTAGTRPLTDAENALIYQYVNNAKTLYPSLSADQTKKLADYAETLTRMGLFTEDTVNQKNDQLQLLKEALEKYQTNTSLGNGGSTNLGNSISNDVQDKQETVEKTLLGVLGGTALLGGLGKIGQTGMADTNNLLSSLAGLGADGFRVYRGYRDSGKFNDLFNQWSRTAGSLVNNGQNLANSLQNLYDKTADGNDKLYEALKEKIKVPTRNGDEWQSTPYYQTATQGSENVNNAFAKALNAADQISGVYNDLGKAKFYNEDDVYGTYRKFANARTQLADRAAALTDSRTYAANRANGVGTSTVQQEAQAENARKYMADLANIDSQAYSDALSYVSNLSKLQTDQRNAAIAEAVNALSPTISTSTNDATNQLRNSQNEIGALWYGDKAADLERGWLANTYGIGLQNQGNILNALVGLNSNNVNAATNLASGFAGAYGQAINGLGQALNKTTADLSSGTGGGLLQALGLAGKVSGLSGLFDGINYAGANAAADSWNALVERTASQTGTSLEEAAKWLMDAGGDPIEEIINASESGGFWSGLGDSISSGWDSLTNWFSGLWS